MEYQEYLNYLASEIVERNKNHRTESELSRPSSLMPKEEPQKQPGQSKETKLERLSPDRQALLDAIERCKTVLVAKEKAYSQGQDRFINFKSALVVTDGYLSALQYALILPNKHFEALHRLFFCTSSDEYEARGGNKAAMEYLGDIANYSLLMMAMLDVGMTPVKKQ